MSQLTTNTTTIDECIALANSLPDAGSGGGGESFITNKLNGAEIDCSSLSANSSMTCHTYTSNKEVSHMMLFMPKVVSDVSSSYNSYGYATIDDSGNYIYYVGAGSASEWAYAGKLTTNNGNDLSLTFNTISGYQDYKNSYKIDVVFIPADGSAPDYDSFSLLAYKWACYLKGTLTTLADGTRIPVEEVTYDTELLVWDFDNGCFAAAKPVWIKKPQTASYYYHCTFENGLTLDLVGSNGNCHAVYNVDDNCFEYANNCVGKNVMTELGMSKLISCDRIDKEVEFYNIATNYHINCYAGQVLTSTKLNNLYPIEDMKFIKEDRELIPIEEFDGIPEKYYHGFRLGENKRENLDNILKNIKVKVAVAQEAESDE